MGQVSTIRFLEEKRREECFLISDAFLSLSVSTDGVGISDKIMWPLSLYKKAVLECCGFSDGSLNVLMQTKGCLQYK